MSVAHLKNANTSSRFVLTYFIHNIYTNALLIFKHSQSLELYTTPSSESYYYHFAI